MQVLVLITHTNSSDNVTSQVANAASESVGIIAIGVTDEISRVAIAWYLCLLHRKCSFKLLQINAKIDLAYKHCFSVAAFCDYCLKKIYLMARWMIVKCIAHRLLQSPGCNYYEI